LISESINYARRIQESVLPTENQLTELFPNSLALLLPKDVVSGDFYWTYNQGNKVIVALADCTGHGVPGAFMSIIGSTVLNEIVKERQVFNPSRILEHMNARIKYILKQDLISDSVQEDGMDVAVCMYDKTSQTLTYAGASQPIVLVGNDGLLKIEGDLFSIGGTFSNRAEVSFKNHVFPIKAYHSFYLYSDGFQDQFGGENNKKLMSDTFEGLLKHVSLLPFNTQKNALLKEFEKWKGNRKQIDDVLILGFSFKGEK